MFKIPKSWKSPSPEMVAIALLNEAKLDLLKAEEAREHWESNTAMLKARIRRLTASVHAASVSDQEDSVTPLRVP